MSFRINIPPLTRVLIISLVGFSAIYQVASYTAAAVLMPNVSMLFPWVYITSAFSEENILTLLIGGATIFYGGKYLERAWGSSEFGKFMLVVTIVPNLVTGLLYVLAYAATGSKAIRSTTIQGSIPIQAAFLVAFKQLVPEHTVTILKGVIKIRVKHFPAIFLIANTVSGFVFFTDTAAFLSWLGFLSSWTYLRFYKHQPDLSGASTGGATIRGDASETFAFAYFWPDVVHGPVSALSDAVFSLLVAFKICTPFSSEDIELGNQQASARGDALPAHNSGSRRAGGSKREEAERRRALALRALDQRLQAGSASRAAPPVAPTSAPREDPTTNPPADIESSSAPDPPSEQQ